MDALAKFRTVGTATSGGPVERGMERVARERGYHVLTVDNGPELRGRALDGWADDHGVLYFIDPGKPTQNAKVSTAGFAKNA